MAFRSSPDQHARPFVHETAKQKALHFSMIEILSSMWIAKPNELRLQYTRIMMGFLMFKPQPARIGMVGLGGGSLAKFCHRYLAQSVIEVVEINPHVIALRDEFMIPPDDARLTVTEADGAWHLRRVPPGSFDVLMIDGFGSAGLPGPLCSQRFYDACRRALTDAGVLVVNLHNGKPNFSVQAERIRRTFGDSIEVGEDQIGNCIVFASVSGLPALEKHLAIRRPPGLELEAWTQLRPSFARVARALVRSSGD